MNHESFLLSKITPEMAEEIFHWRTDPEALKYNPFAVCELPEFLQINANFATDLSQIYCGKNFKWAIVQEKNILAVVGISNINQMMKTAEVGYQVSPKHRRQGIGTKAVYSLAAEVFSKTEMRKLYAIIADQNIPSCKLAEKLGFKQEGLLRKHFLINGIETDERFYGLLRSELVSASK